MTIMWQSDAWSEYVSWQTEDRKTLKRINLLITDILRNGYSSIGKPEPLKGNFQGWWSARIDESNRLIFRQSAEGIEIISCKGHYGDK